MDNKKQTNPKDLLEEEHFKRKEFANGFGTVEMICFEDDVLDVYATYMCGGYYDGT